MSKIIVLVQGKTLKTWMIMMSLVFHWNRFVKIYLKLILSFRAIECFLSLKAPLILCFMFSAFIHNIHEHLFRNLEWDANLNACMPIWKRYVKLNCSVPYLFLFNICPFRKILVQSCKCQTEFLKSFPHCYILEICKARCLWTAIEIDLIYCQKP